MDEKLRLIEAPTFLHSSFMSMSMSLFDIILRLWCTSKAFFFYAWRCWVAAPSPMLRDIKRDIKRQRHVAVAFLLEYLILTSVIETMLSMSSYGTVDSF